MQNFATLMTIVFVTTFFFSGCATLTKEESLARDFSPVVISVLEKESKAGRVEIHRLLRKDSKTKSSKIIAAAIEEGYIKVVDCPEKLVGLPVRNRANKMWIPKEGGFSVPSFTRGWNIYPLVLKKVRFKITNNPTPGMTFVEYEFEGKLNSLGKFLKKHGLNIATEGKGMCLMEKKTKDGVTAWHIS